MIDTEIILAGEDARKFYSQMISVDKASIASRDGFLSDANCYLDEQDVLTIDISDLSIDSSIFEKI